MKGKVRIAVIGSGGRMGQRIAALALNDRRFQLIAGIERENSKNLGRFIAGHAPVVGAIDEVLSKTDAVIDFSSADAAVKNAIHVASQRKPLVIGTTGLSPAALKKLRLIAKRIPIVFSPNMSVGVNLLFKLVAEASAALPDYDIQIVEAHHKMKKDAPSGTAKRLAEATLRNPPVHSIRAGDIVGDHTVLFTGGGERLELTHRAHSRDAFAAGSLEAAAWIVGKKPGFYTMLDVLKKRIK